MASETEIKLRAGNLGELRSKLRRLGFKTHKRRVFESNVIFDTADLALRQRRELLRLRRAGGANTITYKGPPQGGPHKSREEIESEAENATAVEAIFERLGLKPVFRYEKYRTEYSRPGSTGVVTIDETPIGDFLEIEGDGTWIDRTARELGYTADQYITSSYAALYFGYCHERHIEPGHMVFTANRDPNTRVRGRANT